MDNVININAVLTKGESMSDKATQTKKYKNLFEAIVTQVFDIDQYAFHMQELLNAYIGARSAVVEQHHLRFASDQSFEKQIQRLVEKLT